VSAWTRRAARPQDDRDDGGIDLQPRRVGTLGAHPGQRRTAQQTRCDVVGVALELGGQPQDGVGVDLLDVRAQRPRADDAGHDRRGGGPHPPPLRDAVVRHHAEPGRGPAQLRARRTERPHDQMGLIGRQVARPDPGDRDRQAGRGDAELEDVVAGQRQSGTVEGRPEVRAGRGHADPHRRALRHGQRPS
jgi:hypothetical protein